VNLFFSPFKMDGAALGQCRPNMAWAIVTWAKLKYRHGTIVVLSGYILSNGTLMADES